MMILELFNWETTPILTEIKPSVVICLNLWLSTQEKESKDQSKLPETVNSKRYLITHSFSCQESPERHLRRNRHCTQLERALWCLPQPGTPTATRAPDSISARAVLAARRAACGGAEPARLQHAHSAAHCGAPPGSARGTRRHFTRFSYSRIIFSPAGRATGTSKRVTSLLPSRVIKQPIRKWLCSQRLKNAGWQINSSKW